MPGDSLDQTRLQDQLRELARHDEILRPSGAVERMVMQRWAERRAAGGSVTPAARTHAPWAHRVAATAAAMAAIWFVLAVLRTERPVPQDQAEESAAIPAGADTPVAVTVPGPADVATAGTPIETQAPVRRSVRQTAPTVPAAVAVGNEPFVRLLPLMEEELGALRIARVRLRGPAATVLGLDNRLPPMGPDEFVEADVLLGEDGLARAIRFTR